MKATTMKKLSTQTHQSETRKVVCRVSGCKIHILAKNYHQHLADKHPSEDSTDLSPHGQRKIIFFETAKQTLKRTEEAPPGVSAGKKQAKTTDTLHITQEGSAATDLDAKVAPCETGSVSTSLTLQ